MGSRRIFHAVAAALVSVIVGAVVYSAVPSERAPLLLASVFHGRTITAIDIEGGARVSFQVIDGEVGDAAEAVATRTGMPARSDADLVLPADARGFVTGR